MCVCVCVGQDAAAASRGNTTENQIDEDADEEGFIMTFGSFGEEDSARAGEESAGDGSTLIDGNLDAAEAFDPTSVRMPKAKSARSRAGPSTKKAKRNGGSGGGSGGGGSKATPSSQRGGLAARRRMPRR